jgi:hypothetical protein
MATIPIFTLKFCVQKVLEEGSKSKSTLVQRGKNLCAKL